MKYFLIILISLLLPMSVHAEAFQHDGIVFDYEIQGCGPAVFILHGGMTSRDDLRQQIDALSKHYKIIALDSRKQGRSSSSNTQISYSLMANDVLALADHLDIEHFNIIGQSDGGITALTLALNKADRLKKMILIGTLYHHSAVPHESKEYLKQYNWYPSMQDEGFAAEFTVEWKKHHNTMADFNAQLKEMIKMWVSSPSFTTQDLKQIKAQTLIINGDHNDVDLNHILTMHHALPNSQLFTVPDATHFLHREKPALVNQVILDFLGAKEATPTAQSAQ